MNVPAPVCPHCGLPAKWSNSVTVLCTACDSESVIGMSNFTIKYPTQPSPYPVAGDLGIRPEATSQPMNPTCPDCKGSGKNVLLFKTVDCIKCGGTGCIENA
jgi:hypothetical protein